MSTCIIRAFFPAEMKITYQEAKDFEARPDGSLSFTCDGKTYRVKPLAYEIEWG